jgi:hypothetical protein
MCSTASYTEAPEHRAPKSTHWLNPRGIQDNSGVQVHFNCSRSSCPVIRQSVVDVITPPKSQNASSCWKIIMVNLW